MKILELEPFGTMPSGEPVRRFRLENGGVGAEVITYGAALRTFATTDREGAPVDIVLGYDTLDDYREGNQYLGAIVGRCANRIAGGSFLLGGTRYTLECNDNGRNHLHGGISGFSRRVWEPSACTDGLHLTLVSPDGDSGYPGTMRTDVIYTIDEEGALIISYRATCDQDTVCSLSNHAYFNLAGAGSGSVLGQELALFSDFYTPTDAYSIPTGAVLPVGGTPMDFRMPKPLGAHIDDDFEQLRQAGGYDHNWVVRGAPGNLRPAARATCEETGIILETWTTELGIQLYTANCLEGTPAGKGGAHYGNRDAFCLEAQAFPNAVNTPSFPQPILRAGSVYQQKTAYVIKHL